MSSPFLSKKFLTFLDYIICYNFKKINNFLGVIFLDEITALIPDDFTDAGLLFAMFEIRNTVEAVLLCVPLAALLALLIIIYGSSSEIYRKFF